MSNIVITGNKALDAKLSTSPYWDWIDINIVHPGELFLGMDYTKEADNCLHKNCPECHGNGEVCIHMISCPCPKCTPRC